MRRIVVTGMGAVSPLGCGVETNWSRLLAGRSGIRTLPEAITADLSAKVGGQVPDVAVDPEGGFDPDRVAPRKDQRKMDRFILFALLAADEAIAQANWKPEDARSRQRTATVIASGIGGFPAIADAVRTTDIKGIRRLSPFTVPSFLVNLAAGHISIRYGFEGAIGAPVPACAASVQAIGDAARLIRAGEADIAICGGAEACIDRVTFGGFAAARALSSGFNDMPERASRPFDRDRDGFVMGEGAGVVVIEALDHAQARGAEPIAEVIGYGTTSDAFHMTAGREDGMALSGRCKSPCSRREFPRATSSISTRTRLRPPSAITASWKRSRPSSAPMAASPSAQPSPPPAICLAPPAAWRLSSRSSRYAIRLRRKRSTSTIPIPPRRASI